MDRIERLQLLLKSFDDFQRLEINHNSLKAFFNLHICLTEEVKKLIEEQTSKPINSIKEKIEETN